MSNNANFEINLKIDNIDTLEKISNQIENFIRKTQDFTPFFNEYIIPDIYDNNKSIFENKGYNSYGDGNKWADNSLMWKNWKNKNKGKYVNNPFASKVKENIKVCDNPDIGRLTDKMYNALTKNKGLIEEIYNNGHTLKVSIPDDIDYISEFKYGNKYSPPRNIFFIGERQKEEWKNKLNNYLGIGEVSII